MDQKISPLHDPDEVAGVVLAAGSSTRMGRPKALLEYQGESFLASAISKLKQAGIRKVWVVTGANRAALHSIIKSHEAEEIVNENWEKGISSSIKTAIAGAKKHSIPALLLTFVDQPLIPTDHFMALWKSFEDSASDAAASMFGNTVGPPLLIKRSIYSHFNELKGNQGGKKILLNLGDRLHKIPCPTCEYDIDTIEQYQRLRSVNK
ncbi:MAG TPA: hypothetical protein DDY13_01150 [Cytophagales bacterium]|jgi:molybdenum cofactor cytidylyltransferase|nr:hypothetical protein [Cytophagales bacterium]